MNQQGFRSFGEQALHYFDRPHDEVIAHKIENRAAWVGRELPPLEDLAYHLSDADIVEINNALVAAMASPKERRDLLAEDFPLPNLSKHITQWRKTLGDGMGLHVIRGAPVGTWSQEDAELFFWCLGLHLGQPGGQNPQQDLLGHITDTKARDKDAMVRLYQTAANIEYHCDAADVVGLLCLKKAKSGGHSRIVSSVTVFNELVDRRPDLVARLFEPIMLDARNETKAEGLNAHPIPPCRYAEGKLRTFYHSDYFRSAQRHEDVAPFTKDEQDLLDTYEAIAAEPGIYLDMDLEPGDIQLLSNHTNLHARTEYEDFDDPAARRHLLRLWLSL